MSFEAERARIETHFRDSWALSTYAPNVVVIYENTNIKQPSTDFLFHRIVSGDGEQKEIVGTAPALHRYIGLVQVDILVVNGTGTAVGRSIADVICDIYRRKQLVDAAGAVMTFRTPSVRAMGNTNERYRFTVTCPFQRDIRQ